MGGGSKQDGCSHCSVPYPGMHKTRKPKLNRTESMHCSRQCLKNVPVPLYQVEDLTGNCYVRAVYEAIKSAKTSEISVRMVAA